MAIDFLVIGDLHFPWHHKKALAHVLEQIKIMQPKHVIQVGDLYDLFSMTKFPRSHDVILPGDEIKEAYEIAVDMWRIIKTYAPKAKCHQLLGNHDIRYKLRLQEKLPELLNVVNLEHLWKFKGVNTHYDVRKPLIIKDVAFTHGHKTKLGDTARLYGMPTVLGHSHRGGCIPVMGQKGKIIWELNAGYLANPDSKIMTYTKDRWTGWTLGYGIIDHLGPRFVRIDL